MTDAELAQLWVDLGVDPDTLRQRIITALPAMVNQDPDSINQAILNIIADVVIDEADNLKRIYEWRDLDRNRGGGLDDVAADWGVHRIDDDDDFLRFEIRLAKMLSRIGVTENDLIDLTAFVLQADPHEFGLITDPKELGGDVEAFKLVNVPNKYSKSARKKALLAKSLQSAVMPEVRLDISFQAQADTSIYLATTASKVRDHVVVMDNMLDRDHESISEPLMASVMSKFRSRKVLMDNMVDRNHNGFGQTNPSLAVQKYRRHHAEKEV